MKRNRAVCEALGCAVLVPMLLLATLTVPAKAQAPQGATPDYFTNLPPAQPGFPVALTGWYLSWGSSPTLVDLDGNGSQEIVIGGRARNGSSPGCGGVVYAYRANGSLLWQASVRAPANSAPSAADLNGDGHPDIVIGMGGIPEGQCWDGGVIALNGLNGAELWTFNTQDWLNHNPDGMLDGVFSTPAIGDVNSDGQVEIVFGAWDQCLYLLNKSGQPLWGNLPGILPQTYCGGHGFYNEDTFWSSPAIADLNGDGSVEIVTGADIYAGNVWGDPTGGYVYVFDANGTTLAREWLDQDVYSSPAIADLDNDGAAEVVVGTGVFVSGKGYYVTAYDYNPNAGPVDRLVQKWRTNTGGRVFSSPAVGDLNKDGSLEVVSVVPKGDNGEDGTVVYALRGSNGSVLWQRRACDMWGNSGNTLTSAIIADIDGDAWPEVLFSHMWEVTILNHDGSYYTDYTSPEYTGGPNHPGCARDHTPTTNLSYWAEETVYATPAVGDLDGDGDAEVVIGGHNPDNPNQGMLFAWTGHPVDNQPSWPMFHHDAQHTGLYVFDPQPPTNPTSLTSPTHTPGAWSTNTQVQVVWSGAWDEGSGLGGYSILWDTAPGTLPDKAADLPADATSSTSAPLSDGHSFYFHLSTVDRAGNWTPGAIHLGPFWIDSHAPFSSAGSPPLVTGPFQVNWSGQDGGSGILNYTIQVKQDGGAWTNWLEQTTSTSATYQQATAGHTYRFRSVARDQIGHVETDYTSEGDTVTLVAKYLLSGTVYNPRGETISAARVTAVPAALNQPSTDAAGRYTLGLMNQGAYAVSADYAGYGDLPPRQVTISGNVQGLDFYLPPQTNSVVNGGFEGAGGWSLTGPVAPARVAGAGFSGDYALKMGATSAAAGSQGEATTWSAVQSVSVPAGAATLAWTYRIEGHAGTGDHLVVTVHGPSSDISQELSLAAASWTHGWLNVRAFAGQQVEIRFDLNRSSTSSALLAWLDDASLGTVPYWVYAPLIKRRR